jgi:hypothetical protein
MLEVYQTRFAPYNDTVPSLDMTANEASRVVGEEIEKQVDRKSRKEADR